MKVAVNDISIMNGFENKYQAIQAFEAPRYHNDQLSDVEIRCIKENDMVEGE